MQKLLKQKAKFLVLTIYSTKQIIIQKLLKLKANCLLKMNFKNAKFDSSYFRGKKRF